MGLFNKKPGHSMVVDAMAGICAHDPGILLQPPSNAKDIAEISLATYLKKASLSPLQKMIATKHVEPLGAMVLVEEGSFSMGCEERVDEQPIHDVHVNEFYIDKFQVTVAEYRKFCAATGREMP